MMGCIIPASEHFIPTSCQPWDALGMMAFFNFFQTDFEQFNFPLHHPNFIPACILKGILCASAASRIKDVTSIPAFLLASQSHPKGFSVLELPYDAAFASQSHPKFFRLEVGHALQ